jgi:RHS repeat-associated protein
VKSVTGTVNGLVNPTYTYDSVGNLLDEKTGTTVQRSITWTGFNMPLKISKGASTIDFLYDADHARVKETRMTGATVDSQTYFVNAGNSLFFEIETKGTITDWKHYIHAPSGLLMMRNIKSNSAAKTDVYFHKDHLGSITTITNNIGAFLEQNSFDAFGKRRNSNGSDATTTINSLTRRGFTQHEMLPEVNMVHMNGRVYEPTLGRFMSADPNVQFAGFSQSYNRYSYTLNNPLSYTDPSGYGTWARFRDQMLDPRSHTSPVNFHNRNNIFNPAGRNSIWSGARENFFGVRSNNLGQIMMGRAHMMIPGLYSIDEFNSQNPSAARIATVAGQVACGFTTVFYAVCSAGVSAYSTAVMGGRNRDILKSAAIAYLVADASSAVSSSGWSAPVKVFANGVIGGVSADLQGGSFRDGFIYAAASSAAREFYVSFTGRDASLRSGENRNDSINVPCKDSGSNCFNFDSSTGFVPDSFGNGNAIGLDKELTGNFWSDFGKQSGPLSRALNLVPGMNAVAIFHDTIFGPNGISFTVYSNVGTMLPAAIITYGALISGPASSELAIRRDANYYN